MEEAKAAEQKAQEQLEAAKQQGESSAARLAELEKQLKELEAPESAPEETPTPQAETSAEPAAESAAAAQ